MFPEAAVRSQKQAESEDCDQVDIEHFEKILPQLVGGLDIITDLDLLSCLTFWCRSISEMHTFTVLNFLS